MSKYKVVKMDPYFYVFFFDGERWTPYSYRGKYYKTEAGANREIQKLLRG